MSDSHSGTWGKRYHATPPTRTKTSWTKSRLKWLRLTDEGHVRAVRHSSGGPDPVTTWLPLPPIGMGNMRNWLEEAAVRSLWTPDVAIAPLGEEHPVQLTRRGRELLAVWEYQVDLISRKGKPDGHA